MASRSRAVSAPATPAWARAAAWRAESFPGQGTGCVSITCQYEVSIVPIWIDWKPSFWMPRVSVGSGRDPT